MEWLQAWCLYGWQNHSRPWLCEREGPIATAMGGMSEAKFCCHICTTQTRDGSYHRQLTESMEYRNISTAEYKDLEGRILYEDNHLLIVCKRIGEITQGDKTGDECLADTYKAFIAQRDAKPGKVFMGIPHRLDRPVSGITILAKTSKALERLSEMFRNGEVHKTYWALCCAAPSAPSGHLKGWMNRNEKQNKSYIVAHGASPKPARYPEAKLAELKYRYVGSTDRYHLLEVELLTGRHHQIRCQLSDMGCVIKGDLKYGAPRSNPDGGICLHSHEVRFTHPVKKTPVHIIAPVPSTWKGVSAFEPATEASQPADSADIR